jgi:hypothetical protein
MPGDPRTETDLHNTKASSHKNVSPSCGGEKSHYSEGHQAQTHDGDNARGKGTAGNDGGSIEQEPHSGEGGKHARLKKNVSQKTTDHDGRGKT